MAIPSYTWKIVVVVPPGDGLATNRITATNRVIAIKVPNTNGVSSVWQNFVTSANQIELDTGLTFFTALPTDVAAALRAKVDGVYSGTLAAWDVSGLPGGVDNYGPSPFTATTNAANLSVVGLTRGFGVSTSDTAAAHAWGGMDFEGSTVDAAVGFG